MNKVRLAIICLSLLIMACKEKSKEITPIERMMIDTMSQNTLRRDHAVWNLECAKNKDALVKATVDSLLKATTFKIDQKIKKEQ